MSALKYWIWLSSVDISVNAKAAVLNHFGDAHRAFAAPPGGFSAVENLSARDRELLEKRDISHVNEILEKCEMQHLQILTYQDAVYPKRLKHIYAPPCVLYVRGKLPNTDENAVIAVVGTRNASPYGIKMSRNISRELAACGAIVTNGLTRGVESAGAEGALLGGGTVIGVLGTSHEQDRGYFSADVAARGALISEYPPTAEMRKTHFRERNRITAGISVAVMAIEAPEGSNTRLFVHEAAEQGKEIFALPGNADALNSFETNRMIKEGAAAVTSGWEILEEFQKFFPDKLRKYEANNAASEARILRYTTPREDYSEKKKPEAEAKPAKKEVDKTKGREYIDLREQLKELSEDQIKIISAVEKSATHIDDIIENTGLSASKVLGQLTILEIKGYVRRESGKRFALNITKKRG